MKKIFIVSSFILAVLACNKTEINSGKVGCGQFSMDVNVAAETKAALSSEDLLNTAFVKIYKANNKGMVRSYVYSDMPSPFYLAADSYRVDVEAGEIVKDTPASASWEQKSYKGSKEFAIIANQVTNVEVEAYVNNAVTRISFDQTVEENFEDGYTFTIGLDEDAQLIYDASKSGAYGYFIVDGLRNPSFTWTFNGTLSKDGSAFTKTGVINNLLPARLYTMTLKYTIKDGDLMFTLMEDSTTDIFDDTIIFEPVSTGLAATPIYEIWATRAKFYADVDPTENAGKSIQFKYWAEGVAEKTVDGVNNNDGTYHASVTGLQPKTKYSYVLLVDGEQAGESMTFDTEDAPNLYNAGFEHYSNVTGKEFKKFYNVNAADKDGRFKFWASGNGDEESDPGSLGLPGSFAVITEIDTEDKKSGECSVRAQSMEAMGIKLAAGNLFTGQFVKTDGTNGGIVNFGHKWEYRPTALKIWFKYVTGTLGSYAGTLPDGTVLGKNDIDRAQIKIALGTWSNRQYGGTANSPIQVNTTDESTFVDFYTDQSTIANGDVVIYHDGYSINRGEIVKYEGGWATLTIPIVYRDLMTYPTHIVVSCAASQYGDYFIGSTSSKLWLDDFELIYE